MLSRLTRLAAIAALLSSSGLPVAAVQLAAWGRMTIAFARHDSLRLSLRKTFDGRHGCDLCAKLAGARPSFSAPARPEAPVALMFPPGKPPAFVQPFSRRLVHGAERAVDRSFLLEPPPPRATLV